jgi:hypothetical protein
MTWTEFIHIRAHFDLEAMDIIDAFYQISFSKPENGLVDISLLRNRNVLNDFCIRLTWQGDIPDQEKSGLGYQLADAFSKMGMINHTVWIRETSLFMINGRNNDDKLQQQVH